ncbi:MAG: hypothetical protein RMK89_03600 [Armatimonadota bacterium]|nr:hypothetical protein [Armatimonadota bacterium]MDW8142529.1 hypothetical protein [Armatimonadota bacterium]
MLVEMRRRMFCLVLIAIGSVVLLATAQKQRRLEVQLAGIRLGSPVIDKDENGNLKPTCLLRVWGLPDFIIVPTAMPVQPTMGMPGAPMMPGMPGAPMMPGGPMAPGGIGGMGSEFGGQPPFMRPGAGGMPGGPAPGAHGATPAGGPTIPSAPGAPMMPGMGIGTGTGTTAPVPSELAWALPVFIQPQQNQRLWLYRREQAALSFLEQDGIVIAIAVAGERFPYAKTALGDPFRSIELGDELQRVLLRYGPPDSALLIGQMQPIQPTSVGIFSTLSLRYHESSNIEFLIVNNKVVRIFIFLPERIQLR